MNWTAKNVIFGRSFVNTILAAMATDPGVELIDTALVRLSTNPSFAPTPDSTVAGLEALEADYSGYASGGIALVVGAPLNLAPTTQGVMTPVTFLAAPADPFIVNSVYGWWIDDGTNVIVAEAFPVGTIASFSSPGDFLQLDVVLPLRLYQPTGL